MLDRPRFPQRTPRHYRQQNTQIIAHRTKNLKASTYPLVIRLAQMEAEFTKADRLLEAKVVSGYRK